MKDFHYEGPTDTHPDYFEWLDTCVTVGGADWNDIIDYILAMADYQKPRANRKPTLSFESHMALLLWNLWVSYCRDPKLYVGVRMRKSFYKVNDLSGNPKGVSDKMIEAVKMLHRLGLIDLRPGNNARGGYKGKSRCTRIRALPRLYEFIACRLSEDHWVEFNKGRQRVILRQTFMEPTLTKTGRETEKPVKRNIPYIVDETVERMISDIEDYQNILDQHEVTVDGVLREMVEWPRKDRRIDLPDHWVDISKRHTFVYRVFNEGSFEKGGRLYGPWWQRIPKRFRARITIDGKVTVECDYGSLHINLIYALIGKPAPQDPYDIRENIFPGFELDDGEQRAYAKILLLTAINAPTREKTFLGFRSHLFEKKDELMDIKNEEIDYALTKIIEANPDLEPYLCSNKGLDLMYTDSEIAADVIKTMTDREIPVLSVHDSFIVPQDQRGILIEAMDEAIDRRFGIKIPIK